MVSGTKDEPPYAGANRTNWQDPHEPITKIVCVAAMAATSRGRDLCCWKIGRVTRLGNCSSVETNHAKKPPFLALPHDRERTCAVAGRSRWDHSPGPGIEGRASLWGRRWQRGLGLLWP